MNEERFLDANAGSNFADGDAGSVRIFAIGTNDDAFKHLRAELFTFFNFLGNADGVTGADIDNGRFLLGVTNFFQICKTHNLTFILQLSLFYHSLWILKRVFQENVTFA